MEATVPGIGIWPVLLQQPNTWHFGFFGKHAEQIIAGKERVYLDRFWDEFSMTSSAIPEKARKNYASYYQRPEGVRDALSHFATLEQDAADNVELSKHKLIIPVLGIGGDASLGSFMGEHVALISEEPKEKVVSNAGHWLLEEQPEETVNTIINFLIKV